MMKSLMVWNTVYMLMTPIFSAMNFLPKLQIHISYSLSYTSIYIVFLALISPTYFCSMPHSVTDNCCIQYLGVGHPGFLSFSPLQLQIMSKSWHLWLQTTLISPLPFVARFLKRVVCIFSPTFSWTSSCETLVLTL